MDASPPTTTLFWMGFSGQLDPEFRRATASRPDRGEADTAVPGTGCLYRCHSGRPFQAGTLSLLSQSAKTGSPNTKGPAFTSGPFSILCQRCSLPSPAQSTSVCFFENSESDKRLLRNRTDVVSLHHSSLRIFGSRLRWAITATIRRSRKSETPTFQGSNQNYGVRNSSKSVMPCLCDCRAEV